MTYIELINEFWRQNRLNPFSDREIGFYFYLLSQCNIREWVNPFELQSRIIELERLYSRKMIVEVRNKLKQRGLIDFVAKNNSATLYTIVGVDDVPTNVAPNVPLNVSLTEQSREHLKEQSSEQSREHLGNISKDLRLKTKDITTTSNISSLRTHTREEKLLERFDALLQEIYDNKFTVWEDKMKKKFRIDSVRDYLPSFRDHVILNGKLEKIDSYQEVQSYFVCAFKYFSQTSEIQLLHQYLENAKGDDYRKFCQWVLDKAPNVAYGIYPLSEEEFGNLKRDFGADAIGQNILDLNNRPDLIKQYFSLYRTLINWCNHGRNN